MKRTFLITGGAGFFGAHLVEHILKTTGDDIKIVDSLNYSGSLDRLRDIDLPYEETRQDPVFVSPLDTGRVQVYTWDFRNPIEPNLLKELKDVTHVIHAGAESHVDRSIEDPMTFVHSNVLGTCNVLNMSLELPNLELFHYVSTDEVFGPASIETLGGGFKETDPHNPKNPYAATKSAAEQLVNSYANTYGLPCITTYCMNLIGERQHPEKFLPLVINKVLNGETVHIHSNKERTQAGMRTYIHCRNAADAFMFLYQNRPYLQTPVQEMDAYNIVGEQELDNLTFAQSIAEFIPGKELKYELVDFHSSRPGHDLRYALDGSKMEGFGWRPPKTLLQSLKKTVQWYLNNPQWLQNGT